MKLAISAEGNSIEARVDARFGRCEYFAITSEDKEQWEFISNPGVSAGVGAGIHTAQELVNRKVECVLTGRIGPNAMAVLQAAGIKVYTGASGTVREAFEQYNNGLLALSTTANAIPHEGMGKGRK